MLYVSVWYGKLQFLGLNMVVFCHFHTLNYHKNPNQPVMLAKGVSAATKKPITHNSENLVPDFSEEVRISVQGQGLN